MTVPEWTEFHRPSVYEAITTLLVTTTTKKDLFALYEALEDEFIKAQAKSQYGVAEQLKAIETLDKLMTTIGNKYSDTKE